MTHHTKALFREMQEKRDCGKIFLRMLERNPAVVWEETIIQQIDEMPFLTWHAIVHYRKNKKSQQQQPISVEEIRKIINSIEGRQRATEILALLLLQDMAYNEALMKEKEAYGLATDFMELFDDDASYYSNSSWNINEYSPDKKEFEPGLHSWNPLTNATFDSGIIVVDNSRIGIAWFEDED